MQTSINNPSKYVRRGPGQSNLLSCFVYAEIKGRPERKVRQGKTFRDHVPQIQALTGHSTGLVDHTPVPKGFT